jgi:CBS domain-containing protein
MRVEDVMTRDVRTVTPETKLKEVALLLADHGIGGVPVVDTEGALLGVVSKADIMVKERAELPEQGIWGKLRGRNGDDATTAKVTAHTAGDAMTSPALTVGPEVPVSVIAERMASEGVGRLPVVQRGRIVGIVTCHDLVRLFARSDAELAREIREDTLADLTWPEAIVVEVKDGEVRLRGQADSVMHAETLPVRVRHVVGVVSVDSELAAWDSPSEKQVKITARV